MDKTAKTAYNILMLHNYKAVTIHNTPDLPGISWADFLKSVQYLESLGYVECIYHPVDGLIGGRLTHAGKHKREIDRQALLQAFLTHYLPGFVSGVLVTTTANLITHYALSVF